MFKFISFGSGSSGNSYLLYTDTDAMMIDAGIGMRTLKKRFSDSGLRLSDVHNIIVTHDHADHVKSVGALSRDHNLPVYATAEVHEGIRRNYCVRHKVSAELTRHVVKGETVRVGEFSVTPFAVPHDSTDNVGYSIEHGGTVFCLITDAGEITDEIKPYISSADYLVIEANHDEQMLLAGNYPEHLKRRIVSPVGHLSNRACAEAIAESGDPQRLRHVWLCHLSEENNHPELARKTVEDSLRRNGFTAELTVLKRKTTSDTYEIK